MELSTKIPESGTKHILGLATEGVHSVVIPRHLVNRMRNSSAHSYLGDALIVNDRVSRVESVNLLVQSAAMATDPYQQASMYALQSFIHMPSSSLFMMFCFQSIFLSFGVVLRDSGGLCCSSSSSISIFSSAKRTDSAPPPSCVSCHSIPLVFETVRFLSCVFPQQNTPISSSSAHHCALSF